MIPFDHGLVAEELHHPALRVVIEALDQARDSRYLGKHRLVIVPLGKVVAQAAADAAGKHLGRKYKGGGFLRDVITKSE